MRSFSCERLHETRVRVRVAGEQDFRCQRYIPTDPTLFTVPWGRLLEGTLYTMTSVQEPTVIFRLNIFDLLNDVQPRT